MKKLFYLFMVAMCATMFTACSDDDKDPLKEEEECVLPCLQRVQTMTKTH